MNLTFRTLLLIVICLGFSPNQVLTTEARQDNNQGKIRTTRAVESQEPDIDPQDAWLKDNGQDTQPLFIPARHLKGAYTLAPDPRDFVVINIGYVSSGVRIRIEVTTVEGNMDPIAFLDWPDINSSTGTFTVDDDSGPGLDPLITLRTTEPGTYVLRIKDLRGNGGRLTIDVSFR